jgi:hypothetical protein
LIPGLRPTEKIAKIEEWRGRVKTNTWASLHLTSPVDISDIDVSAPGSAMMVLRRIKEIKGTYFADNEDDILHASKIGSLHGITWITTDL